MLAGLFALLCSFCRQAAADPTKGAPPHDPRQDAPLLEAAEAGDAAKVKTLLDKGADPKSCNRFGWPASVLAANRGHTEVLRRLYESDPDTADQNTPARWTPIVEAAMHNHLDTVRFLLSCRVFPRAATDEGMSAEGYAEARGYHDVVAALRQAWGEPPETDPDTRGDSPLATAATNGDVASLARLLDAGGSVDARNTLGQTLLICAVKGNKIEAVRLLLARHADPNLLSRRGNSPIDFAAHDGHREVNIMLLDAGADPNGFRAHDQLGDTASPLFQLFNHGTLELVKLFVAHGARLNETNNVGDTALIQAACSPYVEVLAYLIEQGQSVNAANQYGYTPLMYAAINGREDNIRFLLGKGADLHAKAKNRNPDRRTSQPVGALELATTNGEPYAQEVLMDAGATPANPGEALTEELFSAIDAKDYERVQAALHKGASPNDPDHLNRLALEIAVYMGDPGVVQLLIKAGADVNGTTPDAPDSTPLHDALMRQNEGRNERGKPMDEHEKQNYARIIAMLRQKDAR